MKRDLYAEVTARILADLETGAAPWIKPWSATPGANVPCNAVSNRPYSGCNVILLWMARRAGYRAPRFLTFKQALELGGHVRKGERGTKVYFVKQLEVKEDGDGKSQTRLVPMMREYTVFNVDQCDALSDIVTAGKPMRARNPDARDDLADQFLRATSADIREGHGEAYYVPSRDFAGYIEHWIELLKADKRAFFTACSQGSKAADYLRGLVLAEPTEFAA